MYTTYGICMDSYISVIHRKHLQDLPGTFHATGEILYIVPATCEAAWILCGSRVCCRGSHLNLPGPPTLALAYFHFLSFLVIDFHILPWPHSNMDIPWQDLKDRHSEAGLWSLRMPASNHSYSLAFAPSGLGNELYHPGCHCKEWLREGDIYQKTIKLIELCSIDW